jgi:hypothetical protein
MAQPTQVASVTGMAMAQNSQNWEDIDNLPGFPSVAGEKEKNPVPKIAYECQS